MLIIKKILKILIILLIIASGFIFYYKHRVVLKPPIILDNTIFINERMNVSDNLFVSGNNWLRLSESGLWELYIQGDAYERGIINGLLTKELIYKQEKAFVDELKRMIPSDFYLKFLKYFIAWFSRDIDKHINNEYLLEVFGISHAASGEFSFVGPPYLRFLNYHAAHDIGHSLQSLGMVGCTSFATWNEYSEDSLLIIGRNFDFYVGDAFSEDKIIAFYNPDSGYKFMFITWGGMIGVVSGMNIHGLTVTINAAPSKMPFKAKTPVSILAREILQYATNIEEAVAIANKRETFVAESILIGSAQDNKAVIIEKSGKNTGIHETQKNKIVCTNHFQSSTFSDDKLNLSSINNSSSLYRYNRVNELLQKEGKINYLIAAEILRNKEGLYNTNIGLGNEKAINQLIAHHSVIFMPSKLLVWISTPPYQLGKYVAYDLNNIFNLKSADILNNNEIYEIDLEIPPDTFLFSKDFTNFKFYLELKKVILNEINCKNCDSVNENLIKYFIELNPDYFLSYSIVGDYYKSRKNYVSAIDYYKKALTKEITSTDYLEKINDNLSVCKKKK